MGSHSVTCHLTQVSVPYLNPSQALLASLAWVQVGWLTYPKGIKCWVELGGWQCQDGLPVQVKTSWHSTAKRPKVEPMTSWLYVTHLNLCHNKPPCGRILKYDSLYKKCLQFLALLKENCKLLTNQSIRDKLWNYAGAQISTTNTKYMQTNFTLSLTIQC